MRERVLKAQEAMAEQGLRVIALAYRSLKPQWQHEHLEEDLVFTGLVGLEDPPRPEVPEALRKCREAGIRVIMVTGDHPRTARAIARGIGLVQSDNPRMITGEQLRHLTTVQLRLGLGRAGNHLCPGKRRSENAHRRSAKTKPTHRGGTGDGVNDAPALKSAHIGIAMGTIGTDVAKEAADMVLLDDNFASIVNAVEEGRAVFENIRKFLTLHAGAQRAGINPLSGVRAVDIYVFPQGCAMSDYDSYPLVHWATQGFGYSWSRLESFCSPQKSCASGCPQDAAGCTAVAILVSAMLTSASQNKTR